MATDKDKPTVKGPLNAPIVDTSIVTPERRAALKLQAQKKVEAEKVKAAEAKYLAEMEAEERMASGLLEEQVMIEIDLAPYCNLIRLDDVIYFQGTQPIVPASRAASMLEIMSNTWKHQAEIDGKSENFYRRSRGAHVEINGGVTTRSILRA